VLRELGPGGRECDEAAGADESIDPLRGATVNQRDVADRLLAVREVIHDGHALLAGRAEQGDEEYRIEGSFDGHVLANEDADLAVQDVDGAGQELTALLELPSGQVAFGFVAVNGSLRPRPDRQ
jgi:hypothetical protein